MRTDCEKNRVPAASFIRLTGLLSKMYRRKLVQPAVDACNHCMLMTTK